MRFAGENELHRSGGIVQQFVEAILVGEQQLAAFVGGETPGETDGENLRIENAVGSANGLGRFAHAFTLRFDPITHERHQAQL